MLSMKNIDNECPKDRRKSRLKLLANETLVHCKWSKIKHSLQGVPTLSDKSNFDVTARKLGQISKIKVFSCSQMKNNLF